MSVYAGPNIIENGLIAALDAGNTKSAADTYGVYFDGSGDFLSMPANAAFDFGAGDFTIEAWVYINDNSTADPANLRRAQIFDVSATNNDGIIFWISGDANTTGTGVAIYNGSLTVSVTATIPQRQWNHIAVSKSGTSVYFFLNGTQIGTTQTTSGNWGSATLIPKIGGRSTSTYNFYLNGYISNLRVLKGTALYTANFSPPRGQLTAITNTSLLTCQSATLIDGSTNNFTVTGNGNAAVTTFKSLAIVTQFNDLSGNNNITTLVNNPKFSSDNGGAITLNGTNQYGTATMPNPFAETVIVWAKSATATWNEYGWISSSRAENGHIIHPTISTKSVEFFIASSVAGLTSLGSITVGDITIPHMYCYTTNGSNSHKVYLDAQLQITDTTAITRTASPTNQTYYFGKDSTLARYGNGSLYKIERYNRQLTDSEISQNFNAFRGRFGI